MPVLRSVGTGETVPLVASVRIGRDSDMDLVLAEPGLGVSRAHASLRWASAGWLLRDLGSRNGTWLGSERLPPGVDVPVAGGATITFGRAARYALEGADPPLPAARRLSDGSVCLGAAGFLVLSVPGLDDVVVQAEPDGTWVAWQGSTPTRVEDRSRITHGSESFLLHLPADVPPTVAGEGGALVRLLVEEGDGPVGAWIEVGGRREDLQVRAHHRILLTLAREHLRARRRGRAATEGAVSIPDLVEHLGQNRATFYVHLHRLRQQLGELGFVEGEPVLARTRGGELYIGAASVELVAG